MKTTDQNSSLAKKHKPRIVITTGISGCGEKEYLDELVKYSGVRNKKVKVINVGEEMFRHAEKLDFKLNRENILNADPDFLLLLRSAILNRTLAELENGKYKNYDALILSVHGIFYWNKCFTKAYDRFLNNFDADLFVTFVDDYRKIMERLGSKPQWTRQNMSNEEVLLWQNVEVELTTILASFLEKRFFAVSTNLTPESVSTLFKLIFYPEIKPIYVSMPISHLRDPKSRSRISAFIKKLHGYFPVFDPLSIEVVGAIDIKKSSSQKGINSVIHNQIAYRDLYWFLENSSAIIVYWPESIPPAEFLKNKKMVEFWPKAVASPGVDHETHEAFEKTKDVWVVFLGREASPFVTYSKTKMFYSEKEFFKFLDKTYPERKKFCW